MNPNTRILPFAISALGLLSIAAIAYGLGCGQLSYDRDEYPNCPECRTIFYMDGQANLINVTCKAGGDPAFECYRVGTNLNYKAVILNGTGCDETPAHCVLPQPPNAVPVGSTDLYGQMTATRACADPKG